MLLGIKGFKTRLTKADGYQHFELISNSFGSLESYTRRFRSDVSSCARSYEAEPWLTSDRSNDTGICGQSGIHEVIAE